MTGDRTPLSAEEIGVIPEYPLGEDEGKKIAADAWRAFDYYGAPVPPLNEYGAIFYSLEAQFREEFGRDPNEQEEDGLMQQAYELTPEQYRPQYWP